MKKLIKVVIILVGALIVLALGIVLTLPLTINPIVKSAASTVGPKVLGVPVSVGKVALNPFAGRLTISQLSIGNPPGYSDQPAFAVDKVEVELAVFSLMSDTILVRKIQVDAPAISYEVKEGLSNFDTIKANAGKSSEAEKKPEAAGGKPAEEKAGKKVIIELLALNNAQVSYSSGITLGKSVSLPVPSLEVRDIGKSSGGVSFMEATTQVINEIVDGLGQAVTAAASKSAGALKDAFQGSGATNMLQGLSKGMSGMSKGATNAASGASKSLKTLFK